MEDEQFRHRVISNCLIGVLVGLFIAFLIIAL